MTGPLLQVMYMSSATPRMSGRDLMTLLDRARVFNQAHGITGMLLYLHGNFLQVIEGDPGPVGELHQRIARDPRHGGMVTLWTRSIRDRAFPDWSMGFKGVKDLTADERTQFDLFITLAATPGIDIASHPSVNAVIKAFVANNQR